MTMRKGLPAKLAATDADDTRYDFRNLAVANADGSPRAGVTSPLTALVSATATMNVSVAAFAGIAVRDGGCILLANDGPANVLIANAPVANSRIDVVYAKQNDASSTVTSPDANNNPVLGVAQGTASATPVKPAIPVGALELATVLVPSGATNTGSVGVVIAQTAPFTAGPGGVVPFRVKADLDAWTPAGFQLAEVISDSGDTTRNGLYVYQNGQAAWASVGGSSRAAISFPAAQANWSILTGSHMYLEGRKLVFHWNFLKVPNVSAFNAELIMVLPVGLRPILDTEVIAGGSTTGGNESMAAIYVSPTDGGVRILGTPGPGARSFRFTSYFLIA